MSAWNRLKPVYKAGIIIGLVVTPLVAFCLGSLAVIGAVTGGPATKPTTPVQQLAEAEPVAAPSPRESPSSSPTGSPAASPSPSVVTRTVTETEKIKFKSRRVNDGDLPKGEREKRTSGADGVRTKTYEVTVVDGRETGRKLLRSEVTRKPVTEVIAIGTYVEPQEDTGGCAPGYSPCVPVASDVDCAGGGGDGPAYVDGPIRVTGSDPYELDRDGDGIACDS